MVGAARGSPRCFFKRLTWKTSWRWVPSRSYKQYATQLMRSNTRKGPAYRGPSLCLAWGLGTAPYDGGGATTPTCQPRTPLAMAGVIVFLRQLLCLDEPLAYFGENLITSA
jgi:hypothetical protein